MTRTTVDIDGPVLEDLKRIQKREGKSLGRTASDLLAEAISRYGSRRKKPSRFDWISRPMKARIDFSDKEAVRAAADAGLLAPARKPEP
ncbi:MAG: antitoxin [Acidobacteriota bacterium]